MSIAEKVRPHLAYLRRYARALTGSQASGDAYVVSLLEALKGDPSAHPMGAEARVDLYRAFTKLWRSVSLNDRSDPDDGQEGGGAERNLARMTPQARQAFLLTSLEGFSHREAASILGVETDEFDAMLRQAGKEMAEQVATSVLIIEDEPLIAMDIEQMVKNLGHEVTGVARTHSEAVDEISRARPGMVLADIQLADGSSGIDAVNEILSSINVPVIFITAYPERLLTGDRPEPAFLVTKPFVPSQVQGLISQALFFNTTPRQAA